MSPIFIKEFIQSLKCRHCTKKPRGGRKFCTKHLAKARLAWSVWRTKRLEAGVCCYCEKSAVLGWLRCASHALQNRRKCRKWVQNNKERRSQYAKKRKKAAIADGKCGLCGSRPVKAGRTRLGKKYTRCHTCVLYQRKASRGELQTVKITDKQLKEMV